MFYRMIKMFFVVFGLFTPQGVQQNQQVKKIKTRF